MKRRNFLIGASAVGAAGLAYHYTGSDAALSSTEIGTRKPLVMPPLIDATETKTFEITAQSGLTEFFSGLKAPSIGFNQNYLGPVVRIANGNLQPTVKNELSWPVSSHWHGLIVPGMHDGGPHVAVATGQSWSPEMTINQAPCTAFFHTHIHGRTGHDVYHGLVGALHVTDGLDAERGLPNTYGVDDLTLVLQDRRFSKDGQLVYASSMMDVMHGMTGEQMLVNGQVEPVAVVPKSVVRLRLINGSNARIYSLFMSDNRPINLIATDGGYVHKTLEIDRLRLSPGERAEILIDFTDGRDVTLLSDGDPNQGMGGMMGRARNMLDSITGFRQFPILPFTVDDRLERSVAKVASAPGEALPDPDSAEVVRTRSFVLNMGMGMGMGGGMMRQGSSAFGINEKPFDMNVINERAQLGTTEKWIVETTMLAHPFHVHGVHYQVLSENGAAPRPESLGWKDTVVVDGKTELLVRFTQPASDDNPFMYHCHILEHEDGGMMGQFTVG